MFFKEKKKDHNKIITQQQNQEKKKKLIQLMVCAHNLFWLYDSFENFIFVQFNCIFWKMSKILFNRLSNTFQFM